MPRLSRAESQARTRELLSETAQRLFLSDGYHATSLEKIADAAGFSKGAVYSNFSGKDQLCLVVLDALYAERISAIAAVFSTGTLDDRLAAFEAYAERMIGDEPRTQFEVEFALQARKDPDLRAALAERDAVVAAALAALIEAQVAELELTPLLPVPDVARALLSLGIGLGVQRFVEGAPSVRVLIDTVRVLLGVRAVPMG
ncbi:TetR/AcrR family transcriptional regulator [Lentzea tibetensis]|uniref:TetR/AcrR family transcriptional regulator n=1 Tax=Lentzea tibetensis TaxID=2591470 RepID=A0A563EJW1_9PSEU|nr:TetR/AcrR family transcriptional regulator [Lentzea tibetensis]TWP46791.1 TetR/AcrR family transcriptional regulator [Lentzea tibetensis]